MTVLLLVLGCSGGDTKERYTYAAEECERLGTPSFCYQAASSRHATAAGKSLMFGQACDGGMDAACPKAFRATAESISPLQGAGRAMAWCLKTGQHCELARSMSAAEGITPEQRAHLLGRIDAVGK